MVSVWRRIDALSAVAYRGLSLGITMMPLLFFVPAASFSNLYSFLPMMFTASLCAALGNCATAVAYRCVPVGICSAVCAAAMTVTALGVSLLCLGESLSQVQLGLVLLLLGLTCALASGGGKSLPPGLSYRPFGLLCAASAGSAYAVSYSIIGQISRISHPFLAGYLWELMAGVCCMAPVLFRAICFSNKNAGISCDTLLKIIVYSSPTVAGTACYALATTIGPVAVATSVLNTTVVFSALLAWILYQEALSPRKWLLIMLVFLVLACLNMANS